MLTWLQEAPKSPQPASTPPDIELNDLNPVEIGILILITIIHSIVIIIVGIIFSIYQAIFIIYNLAKYCYQNPTHARYGFLTLRYTYQKEWWSISGIYRYLTEPPPPPVFQQRTMNGQVKITPEEAQKLELIEKQRKKRK